MDNGGRSDGKGQGRERVSSRRCLTTTATAAAAAAAAAVGRPEEGGGKWAISKLTLFPSQIPKWEHLKKKKSLSILGLQS